ncbi:glycoside hydrolase family 18 protein [Hypoxylon sp. CO27-5]|nr:glycoside hydrolase family 18 protein [Hypoxylon sp. CO27-5]
MRKTSISYISLFFLVVTAWFPFVLAAGEECGKQAGGVTCPLNVCCSQWGFCGTTFDFCDTSQNCQSNCGEDFSPGNPYLYDVRETVIGYYETWLSEAEGCSKANLGYVPTGSVTHINAAFGYIDPDTFDVVPMPGTNITIYRNVAALKAGSPNLKVWLSLGGWDFSNNDTETQPVFGNISSSSANRSKFIAALIKFMKEWGFDGVDLDWEYPAAPDRRGNAADSRNYLFLVQDIRAQFDAQNRGWGLSFTAPASYWYMRWFNIESMAMYVDWINLMSYDLHGSWDSLGNWIGPHVYAHTNMTEIKEALQLLWRNNVPAEKVNLGLAFYGRSYTLVDPSCNTPGCEFKDPGRPYRCGTQGGYLPYKDIASIRTGIDVHEVHDEETGAMYMTYDHDQWVSFDTPETLKAKVDYANSIGLRGIFIWAIDQDASEHDLLKGVMGDKGLGYFGTGIGDDSNYTSYRLNGCEWTDCGRTRCGIGQSLVDTVRCPDGDGKIRRALCCALDGTPDPDYCTWRGYVELDLFGFELDLFCETGNQCKSNEVQVATSNYYKDDNGEDGSCLGIGEASYCCETALTGPNICEWSDIGICADPSIWNGLPSEWDILCRKGMVAITFAQENCNKGAMVPFCCDANSHVLRQPQGDSCVWHIRYEPDSCDSSGKNCKTCWPSAQCDPDISTDFGVHYIDGIWADLPGGREWANCHDPQGRLPARLCCKPDDLRYDVIVLPVPVENIFFKEDLDTLPVGNTIEFSLQIDKTITPPNDPGHGDPDASGFAWHIMDGPLDELSNLDKRDGAHWEVFDCDPENHEGRQTAKIVCTDHSEDSNCHELWLGGIKTKVLKMPTGCGPGKYAMGVSLEVVENESPPSYVNIRSLSPRSKPTVYKLTFDFDFSPLQKRDSNVLLRIDYSDNPGYWSEIVAAPAGQQKRDMHAEVKREHAGDWHSYLDRRFARERRETSEEELHLLHERWLSIVLDDWYNRMRDVDYDVDVLRHSIQDSFVFTLFDETKVCQIATGVTQTVHAKLEAILSVLIETTAQLTLIGRMGDLTSFKQSHLTFRNKGVIVGTFDFEAYAELRFGTLQKEIVGLAPLGASVYIPGIVTIGPQFKVLAGLDGTVNVHANARFTVDLGNWDIMQQLPLRDGVPYNFGQDNEDSAGWDGVLNTVANSSLGNTEFEWDVSAEGSVQLSVTPQITFGIVFDPKLGDIPNAAVDFGVDTYGVLFGKAGISSGSDFTYCYGLDVGYDVFARVEAPSLFGASISSRWSIPGLQKRIPIISSDDDCQVGTAKRSVEFESDMRNPESAHTGGRHPEMDALLEMHHAKLAAHDWSNEKI